MRLLVKFRPGLTSASNLHASMGAIPLQIIPGIDVHVVEVPDLQGLAVLDRYRAHAMVQYAEEDQEYHAVPLAPSPSLVVNDPNLPLQWAIPKIQCPEAWDITQGQDTVLIAILDTGVDETHPDLLGKVVDRANFSGSPDNDDHYGHGTHVAGSAAAVTNNGIGIAGVAPLVRLLNVKVLGDSGSGSWSGVASGIVWAADHGAQVVSMSLGGTGGSSVVEDAVNYAWAKGVVVCAAAGNSSTNTPFYPAFYPNCIAVAATDQNDNKASFSNFGDWVDIAAPGVMIYSTVPPGPCPLCDTTRYKYLAGTSMACPHVAGVAALVYPLVSDTNGDGKVNDEVRRAVEQGVDLLPDKSIGSGRLNAFKAVSGAPPPPLTGVLLGRVRDAASNLPIAGAVVSVPGKSTATDSTGAYMMTLAAGTYTVTASSPGYDSATAVVTIIANQNTPQDFGLNPAPPPPPTSMWVEAISFRVAAHKHLWIIPQVVSDSGPVAGAVGKLELTGPENWTAVFTTDSLGMATVKFRFLTRGLYRAAITELTVAGFQWDSSRGINFVDISL
mgnify:FL=1